MIMEMLSPIKLPLLIVSSLLLNGIKPVLANGLDSFVRPVVSTYPFARPFSRPPWSHPL